MKLIRTILMVRNSTEFKGRNACRSQELWTWELELGEVCHLSFRFCFILPIAGLLVRVQKKNRKSVCVCVLDIHPVEREKEREVGRERERGGEIDLL